MTDQDPNSPGKAPSSPAEGQKGPSGSPDTPGQGNPGKSPSGDPGNDAGKGTDSGESFPRSYVEELRKESAGYRSKSSKLAEKLVYSMASQNGRLADPTDLPVTPELLDDDGIPDPQKVADAIADLVKRKPHLAAVKPTGDIGQGPRDDQPAGSWLDAARVRI